MRAGDRIGGKYRLTRLLGEGAMGSVWAAVNETTQRSFALKLIAPHIAGSGLVRARMMREARASGRISDRNVVEVYDVGEAENGQPFLVMQLLNGSSLDAVLNRIERLPASIAAAVIADVARGLSAAHAAGVVHRDLKPANVFLHVEGDAIVVKVVDFGVSKVLDPHEVSATTTGLAIGSPGYMSPEQARGERDLDPRSDLWSLGVLLYELVSGEMPFQGGSVYDVVAKILCGDSPRLSDRIAIDPELDELVASCMRRDRDERPQSATEVVRRLQPLAADSYASLIAAVTAGSSTTTTADQLALTEPSKPGPVAATLTAGALSTAQATVAAPRWSRVGLGIVASAVLGVVVAMSVRLGQPTPVERRADSGMFRAARDRVAALSDSYPSQQPVMEPTRTTVVQPTASSEPRIRRVAPRPRAPQIEEQPAAEKAPSKTPKRPSGLALPESPD